MPSPSPRPRASRGAPLRQGGVGRWRGRRSTDPFWNLIHTAEFLQGPHGCPWDRAQTVTSLLPHLIEEAWELFSAARTRDRTHLQEEVGDLLYTIVFLTLRAERQGWFNLESTLARTHAKMVRRHPHVFGSKRAASAEEAYAHWQASKARERSPRPSSKPVRPVLVAFWEWLRTAEDPAQAANDALLWLERRPRGRRLPRRKHARPTTSGRKRR